MTHPTPQTPARPCLADELPGGARILLRLAATSGWRVETTYARGVPIDADGSTTRMTRPRAVKTPEHAKAKTGALAPMPPKVVDSVIVRLAHPSGHRAVAVWEDGTARAAWFAVAGLWWTPLDVTDLRCAVRDVGDVS